MKKVRQYEVGQSYFTDALSQRYDDASGTTDVGPTTRALYRVLVSGNADRVRYIWAEDEP